MVSSLHGLFYLFTSLNEFEVGRNNTVCLYSLCYQLISFIGV
jgi:hypothetical protein